MKREIAAVSKSRRVKKGKPTPLLTFPRVRDVPKNVAFKIEENHLPASSEFNVFADQFHRLLDQRVNNEVLCCIYSRKNNVELNLKNNTENNIVFDVSKSIFAVYDQNGRQHVLKTIWNRHEDVVSIASGDWLTIYMSRLPISEAHIDTYMIKLAIKNAQPLYLFGLGPRASRPWRNEGVYKKFDELTLKHNKLLDLYDKQNKVVSNLKEQLLSKGSIENRWHEKRKQSTKPLDVEHVINYPKSSYTRDALKIIFQELKVKGYEVVPDRRFPFVEIMKEAKTVGKIVPKKDHFNVTVGAQEFRRVDDVYPWYADISEYFD